MKEKIPSVLSATLTLRDYGRVARQPSSESGAEVAISDSNQTCGCDASVASGCHHWVLESSMAVPAELELC